MHRLAILMLLACGATAAAPKTTPKPTVATTNPCFANKPPIVATEMWKTLEKYSQSLYLGEDEPPPSPTTYGTCKVERNRVTTPSGTLVAELGCSVRVLVPGIVDELGLQLGRVRGQDVLDRSPQPPRSLTCMNNGPDQARCQFARPDGGETDPTDYRVAGSIAEDVLTGDAATKFFASRPLVEIGVSIWCH